jgi:uncharacterized protein YcnI
MRTLLRPKRWIPAAVVVGVVLAIASPAYAHVEISSDNAASGKPSNMTLSVPNEMSNAGTVKVDLRFPEGQQLTAVSVQPTTGWNATPSATGIVWTGGPLTGENEVKFNFTATLPSDAKTLEFKALQTYDNGQVVRWIEETPAGGPEPEHPAPVLTLGASGEDHHAEAGSDTTSSTTDDHGEAASTNDSKDDSSNTALVVVVIIAVVVIVGGGGTLLFLRSRRAS